MRSAAASFDGGLHVANQLAPGTARCLTVRRIIATNVGIQHHDRPAVELGPVARPESDVVTVALVLPEFFGNFGRRGGPAWFKGAFTALVVDGEAGGLCQQRAFEYCRRAHRQAPSASAVPTILDCRIAATAWSRPSGVTSMWASPPFTHS